MKRSEAIAQLTEYIERTSELNGRITSSEIIKFLQFEIGMEPPAHKITNGGGNPDFSYITIGRPTWESEEIPETPEEEIPRSGAV